MLVDMEKKHAAFKTDWRRTAKGYDVAANPRTTPPSHLEVVELAVLLGRREYVDKYWFYHPSWQAPIPGYEPMHALARKIEKYALAMLRREIEPPSWLFESDEGREALSPAWIISKKEKKEAPPPVFRRFGDEPLRRLQAWPLIVAGVMRSTVIPARPPPPLIPWPAMRPAAPPVGRPHRVLRVRMRDPVPSQLFDNKIVV